MVAARLRIRGWSRRGRARDAVAEQPAEPSIDRAITPDAQPLMDIAPNDPLIAYFSSASGAVDIESLQLESPALDALRAAGFRLVVPLVTQGELIGLLNLGPRLSEQEYSADDRRLLNNLAAQAAPAVRVAQLVQTQQAEARERERIEQELRVAQLIQQQFLPRELPALPGWNVAAYYQPARAVGGDFYDFIELTDGQVGIIVGDVTDKGIPAALVMASTRSILRSDAARLMSPAAVLERANELLCRDIPERMFVTCLYMVLDPVSGTVRYANAGHNLPYVRTADGVIELRATGMPLGLMTGMTYEEKEATLAPGHHIILYSDGLIEAHNPAGDMFGFPRLVTAMNEYGSRNGLIDRLLTDFGRFTGPGYEQEDDITLVTLERFGTTGSASLAKPETEDTMPGSDESRLLADFNVASEPGIERVVMERVVNAVSELSLPDATIERLKTAVSEATMNAIEHGNQNRPELLVGVQVEVTHDRLLVRITDQGGARIPILETPDIDLKLAGEQSPRGWGLFLIQHMVDDLRQSNDDTSHTVEMILHLGPHAEGPDDAINAV